MLSDACFDLAEAIRNAEDSPDKVEQALDCFEKDLEHYSDAFFQYPTTVVRTLQAALEAARDGRLTPAALVAMAATVQAFFDSPNPPPLAELLDDLTN